MDRIQQCTHTALVWRGRTLRPPAARRSSLPRPPAGESSAAPGDSFRSHPLARSLAFPPPRRSARLHRRRRRCPLPRPTVVVASRCRGRTVARARADTQQSSHDPEYIARRSGREGERRGGPSESNESVCTGGVVTAARQMDVRVT